MKYKAISSAIAILLIATPIFAQQKSYIVVETPRTAEPTTVITGQPFTQTYVVRFIDLTDSGEEIIVQEKLLNNLKTLGDFEVLGFYIDKQTKQGEFLEHIWYLHYTLNIVNPEKKAYVIPPIGVQWKHKKAGQEESDPTILVNSDFKTEEVHINYVMTIPEGDSYLEIRDEIDFGNFEKQAWAWRAVSWFLRVAPLVFFLVALAVLRRSSHKESKTKDEDTADDIQVSENVKSPSRLRVWFNLRMSIRHLENCRTNSSGQVSDYLKAEMEVVTAIKDFLRIKIPQLSVGCTPLNMVEYISTSVNRYSTKKEALFQLAQRAVAYQADIEKGKDDYFRNSLLEARELRYILGQLRLHCRVILFTRYSFLKAKNRLTKTWLARKFRKSGKRQRK